MKIDRANTRTHVIAMLMPWMMSKDMRDELGEHPVWDNGDAYFFIVEGGSAVSFICLSCAGRLKYAYTDKSHRGRGCFSMLMQVMEGEANRSGHKRLTATATNAALPHYIKRGWVVTKSWKKYHNITKQLHG